MLCTTTAIVLPAQTFTTLLSFDGSDGAIPRAGLVQATNGDFYGTTSEGGANNLGTVFRITPSGTLATLYSFCVQSGCTDGSSPYAGLVQGTDGDFYGTTRNGGTNGRYYGTIFKITPSGTLTTLYSFCSQSACTDGPEPDAGLIQATNGDFYGTTYGGGANGPYGTVFKITPGGTLTTLYSFCSQGSLPTCLDGSAPYAGLVQATNGDFYGTTIAGGLGSNGTIFKMTPTGTLTTLYSFCSRGGQCADGAAPYAGLVQATNGDFYGTTQGGGANGRPYGTIFKITPSGALTTLYSFCSQVNCSDGANPSAGLVQATNRDFYGTTKSGGRSYGTIFKISPSGTLTTLHSFTGIDGGNPSAGLLQATNGNFYGTTSKGGANLHGTLFSLSVGLGPFVKIQPASGEVGAAVNILGNDFTGAISVTFNGTPAAITFVSPSEIIATVPAGATTGKVAVTTSGRTLLSNVPFRVLP